MVFEFKIDGDVAAVLFQWGPADDLAEVGIDVFGNTITTAQAKRLSAWLLEAAKYVVKENRRVRRLTQKATGGRNG